MKIPFSLGSKMGRCPPTRAERDHCPAGIPLAGNNFAPRSRGSEVRGEEREVKKFFDRGFCFTLLQAARAAQRPIEVAGPMELSATWRRANDPACLPEVGFVQNPTRPTDERYIFLKPQLVGREGWRKALRKLAAHRQRRAV